jgi:hypothetical protein
MYPVSLLKEWEKLMQPTKRWNSIHAWIGISMFVLASVVMPAQIIPVGSIDGTVFDSSRAVIPAVKITLLSVETGETRTLDSDAQGRYFLPQLRPGQYRLEAEKTGFQKNATTVVVETGKKVTVDVNLAVGVSTETVQVRDEAPLVKSSIYRSQGGIRCGSLI